MSFCFYEVNFIIYAVKSPLNLTGYNAKIVLGLSRASKKRTQV